MNAVADNANAIARTTPHPTHRMKTLLKREFWEHKGSFLWAPIITSVIFLVFTIIGSSAGQFAFHKFQSESSSWVVHIGNQDVPANSDSVRQALANASPTDLAQMHDAVNGVLMVAGVWPLMVLGFVVFFYFLSALFDERKDRSVLFWKSMPVSDSETVLSKVLSGLVVAPLIAIAVSLVTMLAFALIISVFMLGNGLPLALLWSNLDPLMIIGQMLLLVPLYALWALPTAGWLLLCSAWSRRVPFLWAVGLPLLTGALVSWAVMLNGMYRDTPVLSMMWKHDIVRLLTGTFPGAHLIGLSEAAIHRHGPENLHDGLRYINGLDTWTTPALWIGAVIGIVMIFGAIRLRRWRTEA
ncbi:ABC transporter permease [Solilutibacter silvestris]|uniref:ABC-2 family transporter protein n=1 Tax=Solilutibacter silvestris TaxID=1645665 RepID=A0A2K1PZG1_9GAMM|nr:ABC transporter permease [Lysobacter silvestris]PNS08175.1 ABC-2 family transporter protein [Lysobacter silvestris]